MLAKLLILVLLPAPLSRGQLPTLRLADFPEELQHAAVKATVRIHNPAEKKEGSGIVIGQNATFVYVLTARHVVKGSERLEVSTFSGASYPAAATVYQSAAVVAATENRLDLALLRLATTDPVPGVLRLCPEAAGPKGATLPALAVGCDFGRAPACLRETVTRRKLALSQDRSGAALFWEAETKHASGRSGGALIDPRGFLVGVCSGSSPEKTYFTHLDEIRRFLKDAGYRWLADGDAPPKK
jgi:S1-C subfamily serine protease